MEAGEGVPDLSRHPHHSWAPSVLHTPSRGSEFPGAQRGPSLGTAVPPQGGPASAAPWLPPWPGGTSPITCHSGSIWGPTRGLCKQVHQIIN